MVTLQKNVQNGCSYVTPGIWSPSSGRLLSISYENAFGRHSRTQPTTFFTMFTTVLAALILTLHFDRVV